jgi:F0F1-type ATP synthase assembly protein I
VFLDVVIRYADKKEHSMTTLEAGEKTLKPDPMPNNKKPFKLSLQQKNWILSFHIGFAALWTGTVLSMFLIALRNKDTTNSDILFALNSAINLLDDVVVIPAAIGSVITATLLCWQTNYGFFKFYWVIAKWILTTGLMIFGTFWLFPWGNAAEDIASSEGLNAFKNSVYLFDARGVLIGTLIQVLFLFIIIAISTLKPWGRRATEKKSLSTADGK